MGGSIGKVTLFALLGLAAAAVLSVAAPEDTGAATCASTRNVDHARSVASMSSCTNLAPLADLNRLEGYLSTNSAAYVTWPSPVGNPTGTSLVVDAGSTSVTLQLNSLTYRKQLHGTGDNRLEIRNRYITHSGTPASLAGVTWTHRYPNSTNYLHYRINNPLQFSVPLNPAIYDDRPLIINPQYRGVQRTAANRFWCVMNPSTPGSISVAGFNRWSQCPDNGTGINITLRIRSHWTIAVESRLMARSPGDPSHTARTGWIASTAAQTTTSVPVGSDVYWQYRLRLNGASKGQNFNITSQTQRSVASGSAPGLNTALITPSTGASIPVNSTTSTIANANLTPWVRSETFQLTSAMAGAVICERVRWSPTSSISGGAPTGNGASTYNNCVTAPLSPDLEPRTTDPPLGSVITPGQSAVPVTSQVVSTSTTNQFETKAGVARFVVRNGSSLARTGSGMASSSLSTGYTCDIVATTVAPARSQCDLGHEETYPPGTITSDRTLWSVPLRGEWSIADISSSLQFGDQVCFVTVVNRYDSSAGDSDWKHSEPRCVIVAKVPSTQISGGDLAVRGTGNIIRGASYTNTNIRYGSWAEYGIFGPSTVDIYSGGALAHNSALDPAKHTLTFANTPTPGGFTIDGGAMAPTSVELGRLGISSTVVTMAPNGAITGIPVNAEWHYTGSGGTTISGGMIGSGTRVLRAPGSTVHISDNITYDNNSHTTLADLPQVIIIAQNITIDPSVTQIDAQLFATGYINTCGTGSPSPYYSSLTSDVCRDKLRINGIVQTSHLFLRRTHGAEGTTPTERHRPAEVFNGRSDAYLWQYGRAQAQSVIRTEGVRELPPRV